MLLSIANDTVKIVRAPVADDGHGNLERDWSSPAVTRTPIEGCSVQPGPSQEVSQNRDAALVAWTVLAPEGVDATSLDRVEWQGRDYSIYGDPQHWSGPSDLTSHTLIYLRHWEG